MNSKQIIVLAVALLFISSSLFIGGSFNFFQEEAKEEKITGQVVFDGVIRTYDPYIYVPSNTSNEVLQDLLDMDGVSSVVLEGQYYVIKTDTRDDVYNVAEYLRSKSVNSLAIANVVAPNQMQLNTGMEILNVTFGLGSVRLVSEPVLDSDEKATVSMIAIAEKGFIIEYDSAGFIFLEKQVQLNATIDKRSVKYIYSVPWEDRNSVNVSGDYKKTDSLLFEPPLDPGQIMTKKQFDYIEYIDAHSAQVYADFDDRGQIEENFADVSVHFPSSTLTTSEPDLDYNSSKLYLYSLTLESDEYNIKQKELEIETTEEYGDSFVYNANALISGDTIISIRPS
ncbi:hypothetical protein JXA56_05335 [Candidatus Micrarchaeota archaeon]|nr:hypothetical protein [Candidatus Micrarchaeota archaeon]